MFINKDSIKVNGLSLGPYLVEVTYGYHKIWSSDSGRDMAGSNSGTLVGIFPKLTCQFRALNKAEIEVIAPILDSPTQNVTYYDPNKKANITMSTYTGDWETKIKRISRAEGFSCAFISNKRRR